MARLSGKWNVYGKENCMQPFSKETLMKATTWKSYARFTRTVLK
jgi:hypothetical protein